MMQSQKNILLIEDHPEDAKLMIQEMELIENNPFQIMLATDLAKGLEYLSTTRIDAILLDLSLPDSSGIESVKRVRHHAPEVPVIVLTVFDDEDFASKASQHGAQDYLIKGQATSQLLSRSIRYAIERHRLQYALESLSLIDGLTGLYNKKGFRSISNQHLKIANRRGKGVLIFFAVLDEIKEINKTQGHAVGDQAIIATANLLRETFRSSDIIARLGGNEFIILALEAEATVTEDVILNRLEKNIKSANKALPFHLSMNIGASWCHSDGTSNVEELIALADTMMREQRKVRNSIGNQKELG
jgi:two-component system cell cycle response regulator